MAAFTFQYLMPLDATQLQFSIVFLELLPVNNTLATSSVRLSARPSVCRSISPPPTIHQCPLTSAWIPPPHRLATTSSIFCC